MTYSVDNMLKLVNIINERIFDIKKSSNPKIYIEMLLIKYINTISSGDKLVENSTVIKDESLATLEENNNADNISIVVSEKNVVDKNLSQANLENLVDSVEEEYDFDKEFSDDNQYGDFDERNYSEALCDERTLTSDDCIEKKSSKVVKNIDEIIRIRVNNTLAKANKQVLNSEIEKMKMLNDYTFDQEIGYIVCSLLDANVRAASEESVILSYEYDSVVKQNLLELDKITYIYEKITGSDKKLAFITHDEWEREKQKYIQNLKEGIQYQVMIEPVEVYEESVKDDIIINNAVELFGDIVEIN